MKFYKIAFFIVVGLFPILNIAQISLAERYWMFANNRGIDWMDPQHPDTTYNDFVMNGPTSGLNSISNPVTGDLIFYTTGCRFWDSTHIAFDTLINGTCTSNSGLYNDIIPNSNAYTDFIVIHIDLYFYNYFRISIDANNQEIHVVGDSLEYYNNFWCEGAFTSIQHGNGEDFWSLTRQDNSYNIIRYLISSGNVVSIDSQVLGDKARPTRPTAMLFANRQGNKIARITMAGDIYVYNFDRCSGLITQEDSVRTVPDSTLTQLKWFVSGCFSPDGNHIYLGGRDTLYQYFQDTLTHTWSEHILWARDSLMDIGPFNTNVYYWNTLLGPNNKVYFVPQNPYGGNDSIYRFLPMVENPNMEYPNCGFSLYGLDLKCTDCTGGGPKQVFYGLGPMVGSPCDTLTSTGITETNRKTKLEIFPNPASDKINISWPVQGGYTWALKSIAGVTLISGTQQAGNATISTATLPVGMYFLEVHSAKEHKVEKVIISEK